MALDYIQDNSLADNYRWQNWTSVPEKCSGGFFFLHQIFRKHWPVERFYKSEMKRKEFDNIIRRVERSS